MMFVIGIFYIYANWLGLQVEGVPMYPIADWTNYPLTIFLYFLMGCTATYAYVFITDYINSMSSSTSDKEEYESGYDEHHYTGFIGGHHGGLVSYEAHNLDSALAGHGGTVLHF